MHLIDMNVKIVPVRRGHSIDDVVHRFHRLGEQKCHSDLLSGSGSSPPSERVQRIEDYSHMAASKLIIAAMNSLTLSFELFLKDMEYFHLVFSEEAFTKDRIIADLDPDFRAATVLCNGDRVIK